MKSSLLAAALSCAAVPAIATGSLPGSGQLDYGPRPLFLVEAMTDSPLKERLLSCAGQTPTRTDFSIGHRGAPLMFPEHTVQSNVAAARQGAGILECDVTFTKDKELVCRHAQNDLHTTTDILLTDLADTCVAPFSPAAGDRNASAECRTSELTLAEFRTLTPKMDSSLASASTVEAYQGGIASWRTDLYTSGAELMTHAESIELFRALGAKFTPELKDPAVEMPFDGFSLEDYAQKMIDEYKAAGVPASDVWPQSFNLDVIKYWIGAEPEFGAQAVYLDDRYEAVRRRRGPDRSAGSRDVQADDAGTGRHGRALHRAAALDAAHAGRGGRDGALALCDRGHGGGPRHHHLDARTIGAACQRRRLVFPVGDRRSRQRRRLFRGAGRACAGCGRGRRVLGLARDSDLLCQLHGPLGRQHDKVYK
jgi:glycerophosphoryl diester phosphodiesterase